MSNSQFKYTALVASLVLVIYIVRVGAPFIKEYLALQDLDLSKFDYKLRLKELNHKYIKKTVPPVILFILIFAVIVLLNGGSCC